MGRSKHPCHHHVVILRDVKEKDMELLLHFTYAGEVHIGQEQLSSSKLVLIPY
jgi:hypothetical protein